MVYLDTSAVVPLVVAETASDFCRELWDSADAVVTCRLTYVEAAAALAQAERLGRVEPPQRRAALSLLDRLWPEFDIVEVDDSLVRAAADVALRQALRGYDAVHCAAAVQLDAPDLVAASGDRKLLAAWRSLRLATADTNAEH
ncbi:MAG TPA: type II toxin-antitoxin system VapC family toxin [Pseudonocardiaceae bacterium]